MVQKFIYRKNRARRNRNQDLIISRKGAKAAELKDKKDGKVGPLRAWRLGARIGFRPRVIHGPIVFCCSAPINGVMLGAVAPLKIKGG
jgi:hypothetical protein